jgi:adenylate kinase family enzyme
MTAVAQIQRMMRLHIMGASGSGTSTLGAAVAARLGCPLHDTDAHFWLPTDPPFTAVRPMPGRLARLRRHLGRSRDWVLAGALGGWGDALVPDFDLVVFLYLDPAARMARLRRRETARHGARIEAGGDLAAVHAAFMAWAAAYDGAGLDQRSRAQQESWLADLPCPVLRLDSAAPVPALTAAVLAAIPPR